MQREDIGLVITVLGGIGGWTTVVVICTLWLSTRFRELEKMLFKELSHFREDMEKLLDDHERRIGKLEYRVYDSSPRPKHPQT